MRRRLPAILAAREGSTSLLFALAVIPLVAIVGAAVDYGRAIRTQSIMQAALDTAVLTAATSSDTAAGARMYDGNAASAEAEGMTRTLTVASDGTIEGTASAGVPTTFTRLIGLSSIPVTVTSASKTVGESEKVCILVKDPTGAQALLLNSGVDITAPKCRIDVASTGSPAAIFNSGVKLDVAKTCVRGASTIQNGGPVASLETSCSTVADPFSGMLPTVSAGNCTVQDKNYSGTNTLSPGVYCGNFNFNGQGTLNLSPGLYVFKNTRWNLNSGWTVKGTGVTFYFADANSYIQVNSGVNLSVTAPTSGTYADLLMFEPVGLSSSGFSINGSAGHRFEGLIYLPSRDVTFNSVSSVTSEALTIVVWRLILNDIHWAIAPGASAIGAGGSSGGGNVMLLH